MSFTNISASDESIAPPTFRARPGSSVDDRWSPLAGAAVTATSLTPGQGAIRIARRGRRSVAERVAAASPLRLLTPRNHGDAAWIYTSSFGGGLWTSYPSGGLAVSPLEDWIAAAPSIAAL